MNSKDVLDGVIERLHNDKRMPAAAMEDAARYLQRAFDEAQAKPAPRVIQDMAKVFQALKESRVEVANLRAEITMQAAMIEGARRSASAAMLREEKYRDALERIQLRGVDHGYQDAFEMCQLIAGETLDAFHAGKL